jgi:inosose dehydratase
MKTKARIAGAPISWGVCEVPGWGPMLEAPRVLRELKSLGLSAIELGSPGFLPGEVDPLNAMLSEHSVEMIGGFVPLVIHESSVRSDTLRSANETAEFFAATGATMFVSALVVDADWAPRRPLSVDEKQHMVDMLGELDSLAASHGLLHVIHPHVNTLIEKRDEVQFFLDESDAKWCFDSGHLAIGGYDPLEFVTNNSNKIGHVHFKDVNLAVAARLNAGERTLMEATMDGMFRSLGEGDIDMAAIVQTLLSQDYDGWFVLEQDTSIDGAAPAEGTGPVEDVGRSLAFLKAQINAFESAN